MLGVSCVLLVAFSFVINGQRTDNTCPDGGEIHDQGMTAASKQQVVNYHNNLRLMIAKGTLKGQPRGVDLKKMSYDDGLARKAQSISNTCKTIFRNQYDDDRWGFVVQMTSRECYAAKEIKHNWNRALYTWYSTISDFTYPNKYKGTKNPYNPYTAMIWANTTKIGCGYISFYNKDNSNYPYCKLYTCYYGPGASGSAPYKVGCDDLC